MKKRDKNFLIMILFAIPVIFIIVSVFFKSGDLNATSGEIGFTEIAFWLFFVLGILTFIAALIVYGIIINVSGRKDGDFPEDVILNKMAQLDRMDTDEFENFISSSISFSGYNIKSFENVSQGKEFVIERDGQKIAVFIIKTDKTVRVKDIQSLANYKTENICDDAWYIASTHGFSQAAINLARLERVKLFANRELVYLLMDLGKMKD